MSTTANGFFMPGLHHPSNQSSEHLKKIPKWQPKCMKRLLVWISLISPPDQPGKILPCEDCEKDHPLIKAYTQQLTKEMEEVENKLLTTEKGYQARFAIKLIPSDMKWASFSEELNNNATYFSPFANVSQSNKHTNVWSLRGSDWTRQPWNYEKRLEVARKVHNFNQRRPMVKLVE